MRLAIFAAASGAAAALARAQSPDVCNLPCSYAAVKDTLAIFSCQGSRNACQCSPSEPPSTLHDCFSQACPDPIAAGKAYSYFMHHCQSSTAVETKTPQAKKRLRWRQLLPDLEPAVTVLTEPLAVTDALNPVVSVATAPVQPLVSDVTSAAVPLASGVVSTATCLVDGVLGSDCAPKTSTIAPPPPPPSTTAASLPAPPPPVTITATATTTLPQQPTTVTVYPATSETTLQMSSDSSLSTTPSSTPSISWSFSSPTFSSVTANTASMSATTVSVTAPCDSCHLTTTTVTNKGQNAPAGSSTSCTSTATVTVTGAAQRPGLENSFAGLVGFAAVGALVL